MWHNVIENIINIGAKISCKPLSKTCEIDTQYLQSYKLAKTKELAKKSKNPKMKNNFFYNFITSFSNKSSSLIK